MYDQVHCHDEAANHQLPIAVAFWIIHRGMFKLDTKVDAGSLLYSLILNVTATYYTCSLNGIYHTHWLAQWSHHCSHMRIPVHSPWLPGYINIAQTILIILTMDFFWADLVYDFPIRK